MIKAGRISANGSFVSVGTELSKGQSVFQEIRRPDGTRVVGMNRESYNRALSSAKAALTNKRLKGL